MKENSSKAYKPNNDYILMQNYYDASGDKSDAVEADIQVAFMNMLHGKGLISDSVHSAAIHKIHKGV